MVCSLFHSTSRWFRDECLSSKVRDNPWATWPCVIFFWGAQFPWPRQPDGSHGTPQISGILVGCFRKWLARGPRRSTSQPQRTWTKLMLEINKMNSSASSAIDDCKRLSTLNPGKDKCNTHTHTCLVCVSALGNSLKPWFPTKTGIWVGTTHLKCYCCNPPLSAATKQLGCGFAAMVWWKSVPGHVEPLAKETAR